MRIYIYEIKDNNNRYLLYRYDEMSTCTFIDICEAIEINNSFLINGESQILKILKDKLIKNHGFYDLYLDGVFDLYKNYPI